MKREKQYFRTSQVVLVFLFLKHIFFSLKTRRQSIFITILFIFLKLKTIFLKIESNKLFFFLLDQIERRVLF